jgi:hypothetical protein
MVSDLRVRAVRSRLVCWIRKSGQIVPSCINQVFSKISPWPPQKLCIQKMFLTNSSFCWLLIWLVLTYGLVATDFWIQVSVLDRFWTDWEYRCLVRFLGPKMCKTCCGQNKKSRGNKLSFPMPTQTYVSDNHSHSYARLSTAHMRSSAGRSKSEKQTVWRSCHGFRQRRLHLLLLLIRFID